jgi:hypothetical protein
MEELILKMHEEAMSLEREAAQYRCLFEILMDLINDTEIEAAEYSWATRKDVEKAKVECSKIRKIIGMKPNFCKKVEELLLEREKTSKEEVSKDEE